MVAVAALASGAVAFATPASGSKWWFLQARYDQDMPPAVHQPVVVTRGSWSGHRWSLVVYPSNAKKVIPPSFHGPSLCWGVTFAGKPPKARVSMIGGIPLALGHGDDAMRCGSTVGIRTKQWYVATTPPDTELLLNQTADGYPSWLAATVPASTAHVVVLWTAMKATPGRPARPREVVRPRTFLAPVAGYHVRLFAVPLARVISDSSPLPTITATNQHGRVVARFP